MLYEDEDETGTQSGRGFVSSPLADSASMAQDRRIVRRRRSFIRLAYRGVVANWPVEWRERWGRRANSLEEGGLSWRDAETQAFVEVWNQLRHQTNGQPAEPRARRGAERN